MFHDQYPPVVLATRSPLRPSWFIAPIAAALYPFQFNAVLYFARVHTGIETDWSFAVGDPAGMLKDAWNIRLLPYYLLAVFFVIMHAFCGLRGVILAHGGSCQVADRTLAEGTMLAGLVAILIIMAMCGLRITLA